MTRWMKLLSYPGLLKDLQVEAWLSVDPERGTRLVEQLWRGWRLIAVLGAWLAMTPAPAAAQGSFQGLGDLPGGANYSAAGAVSADGTTVIGISQSGGGEECFRWRADTGLVGLGDLPGGAFLSYSGAVSADGNIVVGSSTSADSCAPLYVEPFIWTEATGMVGLGYVPGGCYAAGYACSADGTQVFGGGTARGYLGFRWTAEMGMVDLGFPGSNEPIYNVSSDGTVGCGAHYVGPGRYAFRWTEATGVVDLGDLPGGPDDSAGIALSADGMVMTGHGASAAGMQAMRWTEATGMVGLGDLSGGAFESEGQSISSDGTWIVGYGTTANGQEAAIWDSTNKVSRVADFLADRGTCVPPGWTLQGADGVAVNGNEITIDGWGINPAGDTEAWIASVPGSGNLALRAGNVDTGGGGPPVDVVFVDGSSGDPVRRELSVSAGMPTTLHLDAAPSLAGRHGYYGIWIYDDDATCDVPIQVLTGKGLLFTLGDANRCLPTNNTVTAGSCPCPTTFPVGRTAKNLGSSRASLLCLNKKPGFPKSPTDFSVTYPAGTFMVMSLHQDLNSINFPAKNISIGNTIVVVSQ